MEIINKNGHTLILGGAIDSLKTKIIDKSIDLIFIDPPYNIGKDFNGIKDSWKSDQDYLQWSYEWLNLCIEKLKDDGAMYVMTSTQNMPYFDIFLRKRITILSRIAWFYDSSGVQAKNYYGSLYEPILFCVNNPKKYTFNSHDIMVEAKTGSVRKLIDYRKPIPTVYNSKKVPGNVWEFPRVRYRMDEYENHPSQKPIALMERIIKASSNKGDLILDPFAGTFTTSYVSNELGRNSVGIELNEEYFKIGLRRLNLTKSYKGDKLIRQPRSFERKNGHGALLPGI